MWQEPVNACCFAKTIKYRFCRWTRNAAELLRHKGLYFKNENCRCGEMVDAHASGACEETHGGSSPFIGKFLKKTVILGLFTPVVPAEQRRFTRSSILHCKAYSSPTVQAESLHRQIF